MNIRTLSVGLLGCFIFSTVQAQYFSECCNRCYSYSDIFTGPYVGILGGGVFGTADFKTDAGLFTTTSYFTSVGNILSVNRNGSGSIDPKSYLLGLELGDNWGAGKVVYGVALDINSFNLNKSKRAFNVHYPTFPATYNLSTSVSTDWLSTVRARLGYTPTCRTLIYATGGLAATELGVSNTFIDTARSLGAGRSREHDVRYGWTAGAGLSYALTHCWSVGAEYLHVDIGQIDTPGQVVRTGLAGFRVSPLVTSVNLTADIVRLQLQYKL